MGRLFLPRGEYEAICRHLARTAPEALPEFQKRAEDHGSFLLYDQKDRCQFLDEANLCRLHPLGLKPSECFWWPYHVYVGSAGRLEVRLFTACCDGYKSHGPHSPYPRLIERRVAEIGHEVVRAFRRVYPGKPDSLPVATLEEPAPKNGLAAESSVSS